METVPQKPRQIQIRLSLCPDREPVQLSMGPKSIHRLLWRREQTEMGRSRRNRAGEEMEWRCIKHLNRRGMFLPLSPSYSFPPPPNLPHLLKPTLLKKKKTGHCRQFLQTIPTPTRKFPKRGDGGGGRGRSAGPNAGRLRP